MAEKFFEQIVHSGLPKDGNINKWLLDRFIDPSAPCSLEAFAGFVLSTVKSQTDEFVKNNTSTCNTPRKSLAGLPETPVDPPPPQPVQDKKPSRRNPSRELFSNHEPSSNTASPIFVNRKSGNLDTSTPIHSFRKLNTSIDTPVTTSTPQNSKHFKNSFSLDQSSTFKNSRNSIDFSSRNNSNAKRNSSSPFCLGDFINTSTSSNKGSRKKNNNNSNSQPTAEPVKFSSNDFPSLGEEAKTSSNAKKSDGKPKKRVVPITVSRKSTSESSSFISSSFQAENNLLNIPDEENDMMCERTMLQNQRQAIEKDFTVLDREKTPQRNLHAIVKENLAKSPMLVACGAPVSNFKYDSAKVEKPEILTIMAAVYSFILDMNLVANILTEFSYLFNLLNTEIDPFEHTTQPNQGKTPVEIASTILKNLNNCIFFTSTVLSYQKSKLALLDCMTIRVLIDNERVQQITVDLHEHLRLILQKKSQLESKVVARGAGSNNVVFFQQETDNRDNFPSDKEFGAFKKQRDMFYMILRSWELKHLDPLWDFKKELGMKIKSLLTHMEHPINMAHLARLFTAQLIISCNFDNSANELQMVLPNIDLSKLSKLRQRLVAPSVFSTQYLFPGNQAFFKDFILCCEQHVIFMEQLKISLISELLQIDSSTMETLCITKDDEEEGQEVKNHQEEFIVRAETMSTMRVLAKFIGYVVSRPYSYEGYRNTLVDQKQMEIRNMLHPDFDVKRVVLRAIDGRKLLVTIPWLVEYLAMLDFITIRLDYYRELFQLLHSIYMRVNAVHNQKTLCALPTSKFIIRACLGWLFEHPDIPENYYSSSNPKILLEPGTPDDAPAEDKELNPHLESIINASCPFLADFRVSVMPQRFSKTLSRTGRYRHITTKFQDKNVPQQPRVQDNRERLIEAFLASQTLSVRRIVDFTIDRVTSAVVKDFQVKNLLPTRKEAKAETEKLSDEILDAVVKKIVGIFKEQLKSLQRQWKDEVAKNCKSRVEMTFDALLPIETLPDVKKNLLNIAHERTMQKLDEWRVANISTIEIFSKDIQSDAMKIKENQQQNGNKRTTSSIVIDLSSTNMPSQFFSDFQNILHKASRHPHELTPGNLKNCVDTAEDVLNNQILPSNAYRNIAFYLLQLIFLVITNRVDLMTSDFTTKIFNLWRHEKLSTHINSSENTSNQKIKVGNFIFSKVISARIMISLQQKPRKVLEAYANFLVELTKENFITTEHINEQSVQLFKHEWSPDTLNDIAFLMNHMKNQLVDGKPTNSESQFFMEYVADLAKEMENF